jgi:hypothetical protein
VRYLQGSSDTDVHLIFFLPSFDFAVLYSQPNLGQALDMRSATAAQGALHIDEFRDPEVDQASGGHEPNPCEYKALKLSQALGTDGLDRYWTHLFQGYHTPLASQTRPQMSLRRLGSCLNMRQQR